MIYRERKYIKVDNLFHYSFRLDAVNVYDYGGVGFRNGKGGNLKRGRRGRNVGGEGNGGRGIFPPNGAGANGNGGKNGR